MARLAAPGRPLRIGLVAPPALAVPPIGYGGVEAVIHALAQALEAEGVAVEVASAGRVEGSFRAPVGLELSADEAHAADLIHVARSYAALASMDVIHDHTKAAGAALASFSRVPVLTTVHNDVNPVRLALYRASRGHPFVFLSRAQHARYPGVAAAGIVPNGIDLRQSPFRSRKEGYLLFLGRFSRVKGPHEAIAIARAAGMPLVLAGRVDPADRAFFAEEIAPHLDGSSIRLAGEVGGNAKWDLISKARALIAPILWEEPFGLVFIEAMACGTPVLAYRGGAAPEIVVSGKTGFLARDRAGLVAACSRLPEISATACRRHVSDHFSARTMARAYRVLYERLRLGEVTPASGRSQVSPPMAAEAAAMALRSGRLEGGDS